MRCLCLTGISGRALGAGEPDVGDAVTAGDARCAGPICAACQPLCLKGGQACPSCVHDTILGPRLKRHKQEPQSHLLRLLLSLRTTLSVQRAPCSMLLAWLGGNACPAAQGMTIFRMWRDEAYLQAMLGYVSIFYTSFVLNRKQPPSNIFLDLPEYQQFLQHTLSLAHGAEVVLHVPPEQMPAEAGDHRTFLN